MCARLSESPPAVTKVDSLLRVASGIPRQDFGVGWRANPLKCIARGRAAGLLSIPVSFYYRSELWALCTTHTPSDTAAMPLSNERPALLLPGPRTRPSVVTTDAKATVRVGSSLTDTAAVTTTSPMFRPGPPGTRRPVRCQSLGASRQSPRRSRRRPPGRHRRPAVSPTRPSFRAARHSPF